MAEFDEVTYQRWGEKEFGVHAFGVDYVPHVPQVSNQAWGFDAWGNCPWGVPCFESDIIVVGVEAVFEQAPAIVQGDMETPGRCPEP